MKKFYEIEMEMLRFRNGEHTLKEWAEYGFNSVEFNGHRFWDGKLDGIFAITESYNPTLELDIWDTDADGHIICYLKEVEE